MKKKMNVKRLLWIILYPLIFILLGVCFMTLVYSLPTTRMLGHARESVQTYLQEGIYPATMPGIRSSQLDNFTDAIMLMEAVYDDEESPLRNAMLNPYTNTDELESYIARMQVALQDQPVVETYTTYYARYWHGYLVFLKPMLLFFNPVEIRMLNMTMQFLLFVIAVILLKERFGWGVTLAFAGTVIFMHPISMALAFQFSDIYYITLCCVIAVMLLDRKKKMTQLRFAKIACLVGIATAFFDFFTSPVVPIGVMLILFVLGEEQKGLDRFMGCVSIGVSWMWGYAAMWAGKWLIGSLLTGYNIIASAMDQAIYRTSSQVLSNTPTGEISLIDGVAENLQTAVNMPLIFCILILGAMIIILLLTRTIKWNVDISRTIFLILIALLPFAWYVVVRNHAYIHGWIEYREMAVSVFAVLCMFCVDFKVSRGKYLNGLCE